MTAHAMLSVTAIALGACSKEPASTLTPSGVIVQLAVGGVLSTVRVGDSFQLSAVATYSDGSRQDVTARVTWSAPAGGFVSVSASGRATIVGVGDGDVSASYQGLNSHTHVVAAAATGTYTIHGVIHENWPRESVVIANARIEVVGGPLDKQVFSGDSSGRFELPPVSGPGFQVKFKKERYDDASVDIVDLPRDEVLDVALPPPFVLQRATVEGNFQPGECRNPNAIPPATNCFHEFSVTIRHRGQFLVESCTTTAFEDYIVRLRHGPTPVGDSINCVGNTSPVGWSVEEGVYTFQIFGDYPGHYRATISYPN
jgi:hypothetical protein